MSMEKYLIVHCAPTLASLKTASLFSLRYSSKRELEEQLESWNRRLEERAFFFWSSDGLSRRRWCMSAGSPICAADLKKPGVALVSVRLRLRFRRRRLCAAPAEKAAGRGKGISPRDRDFRGILWAMSSASSVMEGRTASVPVVGRYTAMNARR